MASSEAWPIGDGKMARRVRGQDWSATPLGGVGTWPQCLKTIVDLSLASRQAMMLAWGPERILFYNDACTPILGDYHPHALGMPLDMAWPSLWDEIKRLAERIQAGEAIAFDALPLVTTRNGRREQGWWTFSFSPLRDESGAVAGVLGVVVDASDKVRADRAEATLRVREADLERVQRIGEVGGLDIDIADNMTSWRSPEYLRLHGLPPTPRQETHEQWRERVHPADRANAEAQLRAALNGDGTSYDSEYRIIRPSDGAVRWIRARADIKRDTDGKAVRLVGAHLDITDQKRANEVLRQSERRQAFLLELSDRLQALSDPGAVAEAACRILVEELQAGRAQYAVMVEDLPNAEIAEIRGEAVRFGSPMVRRFPMNVYGARLSGLLRSGHTMVLTDVAHDPRIMEEQKEFLRNAGSQAVIAVPRVEAGRLAMKLTVHDRRRREWTAQDVSLVEEVAERIWTAIERARAAAALRASEEKYRALFESMDEAYAVVEVLKDQVGRWVDFRFLDANPAFMEHTSMPYPVGKTAAELLGTPNQRWTQLYGQALDTGDPIRIEETEHTLGRTFDLNIFTLDRNRNRVAILFTDITRRKQIEVALRESEEQFRTLADTAPALIWRNDAKGENLFINRNFLDFTGKSADEIRGGGWQRLFHPDEAPAHVADYLAAVQAERAWQKTSRIKRHDGAWRWFENHAQPVLDADNKYAGHVGASIDITDRVEAERALRELQERQAFLLKLSDALRLIPDAYDVQTTTTRLVAEHLGVDRTMYAEVDGEHGAVTGRIRTQFVRQSVEGQPRVARFPEHFTFDPFGAHTMAARYRGEPLVVTDVGKDPAFSAAERDAWQKAGVRAAIVAPLAKGGRLVAEFGVHCIEARDWTRDEVALVQEVAERTWAAVERARAEDALRNSEALFRTLAEVIEDVFYVTDLDAGRLDYLSPAYEAVWGRPAAELTADLSRFIETIHPEDRAAVEANKAQQARGETVHSEYRILRPDGEVRWIFDRCFPIPDGCRRLSAGVATDVTQHRTAEERVRTSDERFRQFGEASQDVLWIRDAETLSWEYLTPAFETIYGLSREEALKGNNFRNWAELIVPDDRERALEMIRQVRAGERVSFEYRIRRPIDGQVRWLRNTDFPIYDGMGRIIRIGGIGRDITDSKAVEARLIESEGRLRSAMDVAQVGLWDWNMRTGDITWSAEHFRMEGYSVNGVTPSYETWAAPIHPEDRAETEAALHHAMETREEYVREFRVVHPDGSVHWLNARGRFFYDTQNQPIRMIGAMVETTARRESEDRMAVLVAELQHRTKNLMGVVRAVGEQTLRTSENLSDFAPRFRDRMSALTRVQNLLSRLCGENRITFDELIRTEIEALGLVAKEKGRVTLKGPRGVLLRSSTVQTFALALHELATNAVKYGALKEETGETGGRLSVEWSLGREAGQPWLYVDWREHGVAMPPKDAPAQGGGAGRQLIERALPYQLGARTTYVMEDDGVRCTIALAVSEKSAGKAEDDD